MAARSKTKSVVVTVDDQHVEKMEQVTDRCRALGLKVHDSLELLGQITGEIEAGKEDDLRSLDGVLSVDESREIQLPPEDSDIQ